ncbi:MAG TPA: T9SS type A sorting domain-containing protein, partial [Bacteroidales bacterium]|nr:T9SS type A sorting domain-containing protein [Bacteroidales bacterium]
TTLDSYGTGAYCPMTTSYQTICRVYVPLLPGAVSSTAGITFQPTGMDGQQFKYLATFPYNTLYGSPNVYESKNFSDTYYGRIYSGGVSSAWAKGPWTEFGGTVNWATAQNTSVWDTTSAAATITATGALVNGLRIHPGARVKLQPGAQLTASGATDINEDKGLWIASDATGTGSFIDNGTINYGTGADVVAQRYLTPDQWHGYCIPFTQVGTNPYIDYFMKWYNNTTHSYRYVIDPARTDSLLNSDGIGYMMWSSSSTTNTTPITSSGILNTGTMSIPVVRSSYPAAPGQPYDNWNFIGNPYPSAVDLASSNITWNNTIQEAYFWSPGAGNYTTYIKAGGGTHSQYAPAQQGFFVRHDTTTTAATTFTYNNNSVRVHNTEAFLKEDLADMLTIGITNSVNGYSDLGVIRFSGETTLAMDENIDAEKLTGDADAPQLFFPVAGNHNLIVNVIPWASVNMTVPMSYTFSQTGNNLITVEGINSFKEGTKLFLEDKKENIIQDMVKTPEYQFSSTPQDDPARFVWHFTKSTIGIDENDGGFRIYSFDQYFYIRNLVKGDTYGSVSVYDLLGRNVFTADLNNLEINKYNPGVNEGYYMIRVVTHDGVYTQKVYIK